MSAVDTLRRHLLPTSHLEIVLVIMKEDKELVLYAGRPGTPFQQISQYKILSNDVIAGPKRQFDDGRIPEGFYYINRYEDLDSGNYRFGINYPNISDRKFSLADDLGKDVYIQTVHDSSGSICLAPASMNELTTFLIIACKSGQRKIPVYIFPFRMEDERCRERLNEISANTMQVVFWENMKSGYDLFMAKMFTFKQYTIRVVRSAWRLLQ